MFYVWLQLSDVPLSTGNPVTHRILPVFAEHYSQNLDIQSVFSEDGLNFQVLNDLQEKH